MDKVQNGNGSGAGATASDPDVSRFVISAVPGLVWSSRVDGSIEFLNQGWTDYTGLLPEAIVDWGWITANMIHPDDAVRLAETWREFLLSGTAGQLEARVRRADGEYRWFLFQAKAQFDPGGRPAKWYGTGIDIHDRKLADELLNGEARILQAIAQGKTLGEILNELCRLVEQLSSCSTATILLLDPDTGRLWLGAGPSLPAGFSLYDHGVAVGPGEGACGAAVYLQEKVITIDIATDPIWERYREVPLAHGLHACWSSPIVSSHGGILGTFAIFAHEPRVPKPYDHAIIDQITHLASIAIERTRAQEALRRSEAHLAEGQKLSLTGSFSWRPADGVVWWSQETYRIYGLEPSVTPTLALAHERVHPEDRALFETLTRQLPEEGQDSTFSHRLLLPDGSVKHLRVVARAARDEFGRVTEFYGAVMDITERTLAEERIRRTETEFRAIVDAIPHPISVVSTSGDILYCNKPVLELFGLTAEEVATGALVDRMHPGDRAASRDWINHAITLPYAFEADYRMLMKDNQYRWYLNHFKPVMGENGEILRWYVTGTDIEERKQQEERIRKENIALREEIDTKHMFEEVVGESAPLRRVLAYIDQVAPADSTVLIFGETGTGKELIARAIHKRSKRAARAFVTVNCAAFPPSLVMSELFGHEKGAFTGATQRRLGRFELAEGGTLFLDEVGELPMETQVALLRVLQEREFERVGGNEPIKVDVRIIAATNRDLQSLIVEGKFRSDLFYRLNVFPIELPPLSERAEDIPLLVDYFVNRFAHKAGKRFRRIKKSTMERLKEYPWPGNIRELQNVIERSVIVCGSDDFTVDERWLVPRTGSDERSNRQLSKKVADHEKALIEKALAECKGRVSGSSGAAARLGMPPSTLDSKIKALQIDKFRFKNPR